MGLKQRQAANYVKIKDGKFYLSTDKEHKTPYDEFEGLLTNMAFREDEYEGQKIEKLQLTMNDGEADYIISFSFDSAYTSSLVGFLKNADLSRPLSIVPISKTEGEKVRRSILVRQDNKFVKAYYTKDNPHGLPEMKKVTLNRKTVWDKTDFLEFFRNVILNELVPQLGNANTPAVAATPVAQEHINEADEVADDLPF